MIKSVSRSLAVTLCTATLIFGAMGITGSTVHGQIVVDGTLDSLYGAPIVTQTANTHFGDMDAAAGVGGSELNAAYAYQDSDRLYLMFTGNIEQNFNKLEVFFDSVVGGENVLSATPEYDFANLSINMGGMTFDTGFEADYHLYARGGNTGDDVFDVDFVNRAGGTSATVQSNGISLMYDTISFTSSGSVAAGDLTGTGGDALTSPIDFAIDNNNVTGVSDLFSDPVVLADVLAASQGFEFSIALADLGLDTSIANSIKIAVMQNNGDHNYLSNQTLGPLPEATANLGSDGVGTGLGDLFEINFNDFAGDQFFTVDLAAVTGGGLVCDFDGDNDCDAADIVDLYAAAGTSTAQFDLDGSGTVDGGDVDDWLAAASDPTNPAKANSTDVYKLGDVDLNGKVDSTDLGSLLNNFSSTAGIGYAGGNLDMDADVDSSDLGLLLNEFGFTSAAASAVPEPSALALLMLGAMVVIGRRRV